MRTLESQSREIGGVKYIVTPLTTRAALRVMCRVLKIAAPAFGDVAALRDAAAAAGGAIGTLLSGLVSDLDDAALVEVCEAFAEVCEADLGGAKTLPMRNRQWEEHFRGRLFDLFEWVVFCGEVTFGPLLARLQAKAPEPAAAPAAG